MKVKDLIDALHSMNENDKVLVWDPDDEKWRPVVGMVFGGGTNIIKLYSDGD